MNTVQAIGAGFLLEYSSCSDRKPNNFQWTAEESKIKVFIDGAISQGIMYQRKRGERKIAWVCESRAIFYEYGIPKDIFESNIQRIIDSYDAVFFSDKDFCEKYPQIKFAFAGSNLPWIDEPKVYEKSKLVSMIASPKQTTLGHQIRHAIAEKWRNNVDLYGGVLGSPRFGFEKKYWGDKSSALNPYMFSVVIENDKYKSYFTEKITDCFATGTIPIYWGTPDIGEYFNPEGIINLNSGFSIEELSEDLYYSKIEAVKDNFERVMRMENADDILYKLIKKVK
jgi:hypothetical protein